jgi:uncharacterized protein
MENDDLALGCRSLLIYSAMFTDGPGRTWQELLDRLNEHPVSSNLVLEKYSQWFRTLAGRHQGWQDYLFEQMLTTSTPFSQQCQHTDWADLSLAMRMAVRHDLRVLQQINAMHCDQILAWVQDVIPAHIALVGWVDRLAPARLPTAQGQAASHLRSQLEHFSDWADAAGTLIGYYRQFGTGIGAEFQALRWSGGQLVGISYPDPVQISSLVGYTTQSATLLQNTKALLAGFPALNILLYGTRGSGKSSLVKALVHEFGDAGLRLVEVSKANLIDLPDIVEVLRSLPQKFVIFVDDLSFEEENDAFKALKVVLEGSLTARPQNVVVYATSNRRHLIREFYGDRPRPQDADEIHQWDTLQEKLSFSDRFGITLTFEPADQTMYLAMVRHLASLAQLTIPPEDLVFRALQWATQHNGRSGRTARQFIDYLTAELAMQKPFP